MLKLFMNLIDSAFRHTPDGGSITMVWRLIDSLVEIEVQDTVTSPPGSGACVTVRLPIRSASHEDLSSDGEGRR